MNFRTEGGKVGKWKKLKAGGRYVSRNGKRKLDVSAKILQDTGRLRKSFLPFHNKKDAGIGSDLPYSKPHEEGEGPLPKRRILPLVKEVRRNVVDIYDKHIRKSIR